MDKKEITEKTWSSCAPTNTNEEEMLVLAMFECQALKAKKLGIAITEDFHLWNDSEAISLIKRVQKGELSLDHIQAKTGCKLIIGDMTLTYEPQTIGKHGDLINVS